MVRLFQANVGPPFRLTFEDFGKEFWIDEPRHLSMSVLLPIYTIPVVLPAAVHFRVLIENACQVHLKALWVVSGAVCQSLARLRKRSCI